MEKQSFWGDSIPKPHQPLTLITSLQGANLVQCAHLMQWCLWYGLLRGIRQYICSFGLILNIFSSIMLELFRTLTIIVSRWRFPCCCRSPRKVTRVWARRNFWRRPMTSISTRSRQPRTMATSLRRYSPSVTRLKRSNTLKYISLYSYLAAVNLEKYYKCLKFVLWAFLLEFEFYRKSFSLEVVVIIE